MKQVTISDVKRLIAIQDDPAISIYMRSDASDGLSDRARLDALLSRTAELLRGRLQRRRIDALLAPVIERHARGGWADTRGMAFLQSSKMGMSFALPVEVPDLTVVSSAFHTKPLVSLLDGPDRFAVLVLGDGTASLYEGSPHVLQAVGARLPLRRSSEPNEGWLRAVDGALKAHLWDRADPVVLAGAREYRDRFAAVSRYSWLLGDGVECDPARVRIPDVHASAKAIVRAHRDDVEAEAVSQYLSASREPGRTCTDLELLCRGAAIGRVGLLLHSRGAHLWGTVSQTGECRLRAGGRQEGGDSDVIDDLCQLVFLSGGNVVEISPDRMPCASPVCAIVSARVTLPAAPRRSRAEEVVS